MHTNILNKNIHQFMQFNIDTSYRSRYQLNKSKLKKIEKASEMQQPSCKSNSFGQLLGHLFCLFTLIINIYGLGQGISTIKKFTSGRGWGMTPLEPEL